MIENPSDMMSALPAKAGISRGA